jgi:hypothetical protein
MDEESAEGERLRIFQSLRSGGSEDVTVLDKSIWI